MLRSEIKSDSVPSVPWLPHDKAARATTPTTINRSIINARSLKAANRSSSTSKVKKSIDDIPLAKIARRSSSSRRRRRAENDTTLADSLQLDCSAVYEEYKKNFKQPLLVRDARSAMGKLFEKQDYETIDSFRRCQENLSLLSRQRAISIPAHVAKFVDAHKAFVRIDKKLRQLVCKALQREPHLLKFIEDLESVVIYFSEYLDLPEPESYHHLHSQLATPLACDAFGRMVCVDLNDSRLARLMLHTVVKFYSCSYLVGRLYTYLTDELAH
jgi:hypothetical protein